MTIHPLVGVSQVRPSQEGRPWGSGIGPNGATIGVSPSIREQDTPTALRGIVLASALKIGSPIASDHSSATLLGRLEEGHDALT